MLRRNCDAINFITLNNDWTIQFVDIAEGLGGIIGAGVGECEIVGALRFIGLEGEDAGFIGFGADVAQADLHGRDGRLRDSSKVAGGEVAESGAVCSKKLKEIGGIRGIELGHDEGGVIPLA